MRAVKVEDVQELVTEAVCDTQHWLDMERNLDRIHECAVDVEDVTRCEECMYWDRTKSALWKKCDMLGAITPHDFYCACGERK